jgi:transcriptional regulator with XRE-family HTH domain
MSVTEPVERLLAISEVRAMLREGRLRELRERHSLSQHELARALGVDPSTVSRWESGERVPLEAAAARLHAFLSALERATSSRDGP